MSTPPAWPKAYSDLGCSAGFKARPEDFEVDEALGFEPVGAGEHLYLRLEKRSKETRVLAREVAAAYGVATIDVGYAGMKDKHAVTRQWFSVCTSEADDVARAAGFRVLQSSRHQRKLRRGQLARNTFAVLLRGVSGVGWQERLAAISASGVPNYYGPQRFGQDNLARAREWLRMRRQRSISRFKQGLYLSVLRSYLFNQVLARRVRDGSWCDLLAGDVRASENPETAAYCVATAPLWGRGRSATTELAGELEAAALAPYAEICEGLEYAGVRQQRRTLVLRPDGLSWTTLGQDLSVRFDLLPGCYATTLLAEAFALDLSPDSPTDAAIEQQAQSR
ncbi:MAG: tRNA pseudouridine(13) synthase TruD [Gammaproteobacteria bacterium]|nr:tRNA pseudouridine(13) synthase TruD [Gammaproteobacteria bacterium]